ncbi:hypothetical protein RJ640_023436 [Escallonia rubra]|uniref:Uncharacterized protein n=1 Tax=Escallonia rubra TaxID=112253 RepID=A0AA88U3N9_9ASTE|nr:hypothetical protein RJ640_023436 [Escallonia rubra]
MKLTKLFWRGSSSDEESEYSGARSTKKGDMDGESGNRRWPSFLVDNRRTLPIKEILEGSHASEPTPQASRYSRLSAEQKRQYIDNVNTRRMRTNPVANENDNIGAGSSDSGTKRQRIDWTLRAQAITYNFQVVVDAKVLSTVRRNADGVLHKKREAAKKKKKKSKNKKKKEVPEQTDPPTIPVTELFPSGEFPEGEIQQYKDE